MSQLFTWRGQSTGASALASFLPKKSQGWSPSEWTGWISLQSKGLSRVFSNTTVQKHQFFSIQLSSQSNSHIHTCMTTGKTVALTRRTLVSKVMSLLFNTLSRLVITSLPRSKHLLISWLQYTQSTSCEIEGWMKHRLESRLPGEISITSICRWHHHYDRKWRGTEEPLDESEKGELAQNSTFKN